MTNKIFFIPGTMCNEQLWSSLYEEPCIDDTPVFLSIPNHKPFEQIAQHILSFLPAEKINLVGFSLGGYIASYLACFHPERFEKVLVIANSPTALNEQELTQRQHLVDWVNRHGYNGMSRQKAINFLDNTQPETYAFSDREKIIQLILDMDQALGQETLLSQMLNTTHRESLVGRLSQIAVPVTFYASEQDSLVNWSSLKKLVNINPNHKIKLSKGSGHMLPLEKPQELARHIASWLRNA